MPPEVTYVLTYINVLRDRVRQRAEENGKDRGLTTLEVAILAGGLTILAGTIIGAITMAVNNRKTSIK
ncbi:hypothetical protein ACFY4C_40480 [Actinomadura viridis]|uniref:hypothetical protein n=1 Tax=Actinomadura viridis TaxID=58110 RepID=UPI0036A915B7